MLELCPVQCFLLRVALLTPVVCPYSLNFILYQIKIYFLLPVVLFQDSICRCPNTRGQRQDVRCLFRQNFISVLLF